MRELPMSRQTVKERAGVALTAALAVAALTTGLSGCGGKSAHANPTTPTDPTATQSTPTVEPTTSTPRSTTTAPPTTVQGPSGNPENYPAAKPTPPSLAGAYPTGTSVNVVTVLKTLTAYGD